MIHHVHSPETTAPAAAQSVLIQTSALTVSIIIPALNEAESLPHVLPLIPSWINEIILVDGQFD